ncbi:MAG: hypothetical protein OEU26_13385 [Candidatus Tectomicrobia bacterium]|nr:hypothetical protein [Candidatus Tectomicrobia bacterium]
MKCPKCSYVSHDYLDMCRNSKCSIDLVDFKAQMQLHVIQAGHIDLVTVLGGAESYGAGSAINESFFDSGMLMESEANGDFDISLDDDLSLATMSISVDESAEISGIFNRPGFSFDIDEASASTMSNRSSTGAPLGPPKSGYATVMLDVGDMADPNDPTGEAVDAVVDTPTGNDIDPSRDLEDLDAGFTPSTGIESAIAFTAEDPMPEVEDTEAEMAVPDVIPNHTDAVTMPTESGEIDLSSEHFALSFEVAEAHLVSESIDDLDLPEMDLAAASLSTPVDEDVSASTEAAFADFLPLQSEELDLPSLSTQEAAFDSDPDTTMVDDANVLTLADEVFDLSPPPTQEITHIDTQEVTQDQIPQDDDFVLPTSPITGEQELDQPQDAAPGDEIASQTLTDDVFILPIPPIQEVTLVDTQEATQDQIPQGDDFALPPLPMQDLTSTHPQDATVADEENSQTLHDGMFNRPAELTQEQTLIETQEGARIEDGLTPAPTGGDAATGTPRLNPEEDDDDWLENDEELEFGDETPPAL